MDTLGFCIPSRVKAAGGTERDKAGIWTSAQSAAFNQKVREKLGACPQEQ